jgi:16S rRNA (uracil1498-N3)-methyltransferase
VVERDDRPPVATFYADPAGAPLAPAAVIALSESAAHHARVKRLEVGDPIRLTDGAGRVATGRLLTLDRARAEVDITTVDSVDRPRAIHLRVPIGDRDRMLWLAEKATELGVASWQGVRFRRSASVSPRGEGAQFAEKVRARMISALEQSGGGWLPQQLPDTTLGGLVDALVSGSAPRLLLDIDGEPLLRALRELSVPPAECVLVFGPEGGLEAEERVALVQAGCRLASLAATTLRFETAGLAAAAIVHAAQERH